MALTIPTVKQELKALREERQEIDRKIRGLEEWLGGKATGSVRNMADIRPAVIQAFKANGNAPLQVKDIVEVVCEQHPELDKDTVSKKMFNVIRTVLVKESYGKYRLKETA